MLKLKIVAIVMLLLASVGYAKSPTLLLQEGIYAEETEGDLEKAIGLYQQVLEQYKEVERLAARATYQLGMCHLKKGENEKAVEYFEEVVDYYPEQKRLVKKAQAQLDKIGVSRKADGNVFDVLGPEICSYIGSKYGEVCAEAGMKKLYSNSHIYVVDNKFVLRFGGMGYVYNWTGEPITQRHRLSGTSYPNQKLYSMLGDEMDIEIVPDERRSGFYHVYWNPKEPLEPGGFFNYGWATDGADDRLLPKGPAGRYSLNMQNKFGDHCYETFFLVVPEGTILASQSEEYTKMNNMEGWDIYWWKKEVPPNTNHVVNVVFGTEPIMTVEEAVKTISVCAEGDARVGVAMENVKKLDESAVLSELKEYLASDEDAIRRSAVYILWQGEFSDITADVAELEQLCSHQEDLTRGMAGLAIGQNKVLLLFTALEEMTLNDPSGYARRCGAYALGLMGDARAIPILEKALNDSESLVRNNAKAALKMLELKSSEIDPIANNKKEAEGLTAQGWKLWGQRKLAEAEDKFKEAIAKDPTSENAYQGLGWAQFNQGKNLNATESFEKCVKLNPSNSAALNGLGWLAHGQGDTDEAIGWWEKAVQASNGNATASLNGLTTVYMEKEEYDKAVQYYKMWLKAEPNNKQAKEGLKKAKASQ